MEKKGRPFKPIIKHLNDKEGLIWLSLINRERNGNQIAKEVGINQTNIYKYLKRLEKSKLIEVSRAEKKKSPQHRPKKFYKANVEVALRAVGNEFAEEKGKPFFNEQEIQILAKLFRKNLPEELDGRQTALAHIIYVLGFLGLNALNLKEDKRLYANIKLIKKIKGRKGKRLRKELERKSIKAMESGTGTLKKLNLLNIDIRSENLGEDLIKKYHIFDLFEQVNEFSHSLIGKLIKINSTPLIYDKIFNKNIQNEIKKIDEKYIKMIVDEAKREKITKQ